MRLIHRTLALAFTLSLGLGLSSLGCGGALGPLASGRGDAEVPERVALGIRACAAEHARHLHAEQTLRFEVVLANNGQVDEVSLRSATLDDEGLETCVASALRSLSEADLGLRRAEARPGGAVAPEGRALLGQHQLIGLAACLELPPCALALAITAGVGVVVVVWVYVYPSPYAGPVTHAPPTVTIPQVMSASPMSSTIAPPMPTTLSPGDEKLWRECNQQYNDYKKLQDDASDLSKEAKPLKDLVHNNDASALQRKDYCSLLNKLIPMKEREQKVRSRYMDLSCDKFDWYNTGLTAAERLVSHQNALVNVTNNLNNLYAEQKRFCR